MHRSEPIRGVRLIAAQTALIVGKWLLPADRLEREATLAAARTVLGEEAFAAAWAEGQAMTLEEAVEYALADGPSTVRRDDEASH